MDCVTMVSLSLPQLGHLLLFNCRYYGIISWFYISVLLAFTLLTRSGYLQNS